MLSHEKSLPARSRPAQALRRQVSLPLRIHRTPRYPGADRFWLREGQISAGSGLKARRFAACQHASALKASLVSISASSLSGLSRCVLRDRSDGVPGCGQRRPAEMLTSLRRRRADKAPSRRRADKRSPQGRSVLTRRGARSCMWATARPRPRGRSHSTCG
jgi:hypothetical protein